MTALMDLGPLKGFFPAGHLDAVDLGRAEEYVQPLVDLGYLDREDYHPQRMAEALADQVHGPASRRLRRHLEQALARFRQEALDEGLLRPGEVGEGLTPDENPAIQPGAVELDLLHRLVSLDGETVVPELPERGTVDLHTRLLHYQLDILGLYQGKMEAPFSTASLQGIWQLQNWLRLPREVDVLPLLGDVADLGERVLEMGWGLEANRAFAFFKEPFRGMGSLGKAPVAFKREVKRTMGEERLEQLSELVNPDRLTMRHRLQDEDQVGDLTRDPFNRFLLRLVQVRQWMRGFYNGKLDSWFGPKSIRSLEEYAEALDFEVGEILMRAGTDRSGQNYWVLNYPGLLDRIRSHEFQARGAESVTDAVETMQDHLDHLDESTLDEVVNHISQQAREHHRQTQEDLLQGRRRYFGIRSLGRALRNSFDKFKSWLVKGTVHLFNLGKNALHMVWRHIREGLRMFRMGVGFLFKGKEVLTRTPDGQAIVSDFDFDMDFALAVPAGVEEALLNSHLDTVAQSVHSLQFALRVTGAVLNWVLHVAQGPVGWLKLGLRAARELKRALTRRLLRKVAGVGLQLAGWS